MNVLSLNSHLLHRMWRQQSSNLGHDCTIEALEDNGVLNLEETVNEDHIDCGTESFDDLDLEDCALKNVVLFSELLRDSYLTLIGEVSNQIRQTFSSDGRSWHETEEFIDVTVLVVKGTVQSLLSKGKRCLLKSVSEFILAAHLLGFKRVTSIVVLLCLPLVNSINLVQGHDEGALLLTKELHGFECLLLKTMHDINDEDGDITQR